MLRHILFLKFSMLYETIVWFFFIFEKLGRMHENKAFCVCVYNFYNVSMKTGYFNINFVFLQYKNTNHKINIREKTANLSSFFFWVGSSSIHVVGLGKQGQVWGSSRVHAQLLLKWIIITWTVKSNNYSSSGL
jgi:hypothetical protein